MLVEDEKLERTEPLATTHEGYPELPAVLPDPKNGESLTLEIAAKRVLADGAMALFEDGTLGRAQPHDVLGHCLPSRSADSSRNSAWLAFSERAPAITDGCFMSKLTVARSSGVSTSVLSAARSRRASWS